MVSESDVGVNLLNLTQSNVLGNQCFPSWIEGFNTMRVTFLRRNISSVQSLSRVHHFAFLV